MTVAEAIKHPTATIIILAEITTRFYRNAWVEDGGFADIWKLGTTFADRAGKTRDVRVSDVAVDGVTLTLPERPNLADLDANGQGWVQTGGYLYIKYDGDTPFQHLFQPIVSLYFSTLAKVLGIDPIYYEERAMSGPAVSQRIEAVFGEVGQVGGGTLVLTNSDGYLSNLEGFQWDAGTVTLKLGVDSPQGGEMSYLDYETLATWNVEAWRDDGDTFELTLKEPKAGIRTKIPVDIFSRDDFPNLEDDIVGKPIPIAYGQLYGIAPTVVDPGTKTFKVAGHAIRGFDGVRLKKTRVEAITRSLSTLSWLDYSGTTKRYYIADEAVKTVTFKGVATTEENDVADVVSTAGRWAYSENYVYVNPPSGQDWSEGAVTVVSEQSSPQMVTADFESVDPENGEFTLGDDWSVGTDVAVDFRGKVDNSGLYLENAIDIIQDLLTTVGITNLNSASFLTARARLKRGTDENGNEVHYLRPSLYLSDLQDVLDIIGEINALARSFVYSDNTGQFSVGVFKPQVSEGLPEINDTQILSYEKRFDVAELVTRVVTRFQNRPVDGFSQSHTEDYPDLQKLHNQPNPVSKEVELPTAFQDDAQYWAQAIIGLIGEPVARHQFIVPWVHMTLTPGDQVNIESEQLQISGVFEVLEKRLDLGTKRVTLIVGNLRGLEDAPGHWVDSSDLLPTRFAQLTGYGSGSLVWNDAWDPAIKAWARKNVGYWTDENGFADPADSASWNSSTWI